MTQYLVTFHIISCQNIVLFLYFCTETCFDKIILWLIDDSCPITFYGNIIFFWNFWRKEIWEILQFMESPELNWFKVFPFFQMNWTCELIFHECNKVHIFWEGHKILKNLHLTFDWHYIMPNIWWHFSFYIFTYNISSGTVLFVPSLLEACFDKLNSGPLEGLKIRGCQ